MASQEVYALRLTDSGAPDMPGSYIYLPAPGSPYYLLRFIIQGTSSICREGCLWINMPGEGEEFSRESYRQYPLSPDFTREICIDVPVTQAGSFAYYFTYTPRPEFSIHPQLSPRPERTNPYYVDVCPSLLLQGYQLPLNALSIFSVLSKFMGKYPEDWDRHLNGISQREYNMVHFTPLMMRGESNSPYSIYDQLTFDPTCFPNGESDIKALVEKMEHTYGLLGLTDVVLNHTANNSKWLQEHPEAGYNCLTAPWLQSAYELDTALLDFSAKLNDLGFPTNLQSDDDLLKVMDGIKDHVMNPLRLWEFYVVNVERDCKATINAWKSGQVEFPKGSFGARGVSGLDQVSNWTLKEKADWMVDYAMGGNDHLGDRYRRRIEPPIGAALVSAMYGRYDPTRQGEYAREIEASDALQKILDEVNLHNYREFDADNEAILEQLFNRIKYMRYAAHGPKMGSITQSSPLIESYFARLPQNTTTKAHDPRSLALVCNGWIWAADALRDNAGPDCKAYLRREVIVWGDCVKLRYGNGPQDNPFLWDFMSRYTRLMATYFHGFRIDNCHSTPIHVAEYMLDQARKVRPNLFVAAELFSGSENMDEFFVKRLGLACCIREAMQAWSTQELSRLVHRHGGQPIGSFERENVVTAEKSSTAINGYTEVIRTVQPSAVHALFMDCTHDNQTPAQKRDARDALPNAALVAMCNCATGSVFGYDECYPELVELVHETRPYSSPYSTNGTIEIKATEGGMGEIKKLINQIHNLMGREHYNETYIHHDNEYITVHRCDPKTRKGYFLIAHTAFPGYGNGNGGFPQTKLQGTRADLIGAWKLEVDSSDATKEAVIKDSVLRGLPARTREISGVRCDFVDGDAIIEVPSNFPPGSICVFQTWIPEAEQTGGLDQFLCKDAGEACRNLSLADINYLMYRCDVEERDASSGSRGVYNISNHGPLVYAGLQGFMSVLKGVVRENNLGHPICNNLREGTWSFGYCVSRLTEAAESKRYEKLGAPAKWLSDRFAAINSLPSYLRPRYCAMILGTLHAAAIDQSMNLMSTSIRDGPEFLRNLAMVSNQVMGFMDSASLWPAKKVPSMAAGLPHFASSWARCWGRDIMISLRGLLTCTGRYADAKEHILAFASVIKHGMIPNLLGSGENPRYNSRDSVWWFLQCIQDYVKMSPEGHSFLQARFKRRFLPYDDTYFPYDDSRAYSVWSTIEESIQEIMQRHATGIEFREYNAGSNLDSQMKPEGFNLKIWVDWDNGFVFGGNQYNCGTWMDKMGESEKAGNKGVPGTPRDGAAIEISGMLFSCVHWLQELHEKGLYRWSGVTLPDGSSQMSWKNWEALMKDNFDRCYYIPRVQEDDHRYDIVSNVVNRRGIYKDLYRSGKVYEDYQLRPNFPIAMVVAPELFDPAKALNALWVADQCLRKPYGMATLDPSDLNYRPNYNNAEDSTDFHTARGRNYHQGPEWGWPLGFFLRALLRFDMKRRTTPAERLETYQLITYRLTGPMEMIKTSPWAGLTELTNLNGSFCGDSCPTQAWSAACIVDLYQEAIREREEYHAGVE